MRVRELEAAAKEAAEVLREEAESLKQCHTIHGDWPSYDVETKTIYDHWIDIADRLDPVEGDHN